MNFSSRKSVVPANYKAAVCSEKKLFLAHEYAIIVPCGFLGKTTAPLIEVVATVVARGDSSSVFGFIEII